MQHAPNLMLDKSDNSSSTEHFLVFGYKVVPCSKRYRHDWSVCPFAHTGEMAARRDPSRYIPIFCFHSKQRLPCPRGDECPYSHNLFEYWLHPKRYRTEMCQFGAACTRPVCFFAHGEHQLRQTDMPGGPQPVVAPPEPVPALNGGFGNSRDLGAPIDPAVKQQQQLMALQAAAAGFSHQQQQQQQHQQQQAAAVAVAAAAHNMGGGPGSGMDASGLGGGPGGGLHHVSSFPGMVDTSAGGLGGPGMNGGAHMGGGSGMNMNGMGGLQSPLGLAASSPLSAPLPQLSPDVLAALQSMGNGSGGGGGNGGSGMGTLMHQHSAIPAHFGDTAMPPPGRLQRSLTAHPSVNAAAAAAAAANDNSSNLNELSKQLAFMQLLGGAGGAGGGGGADASGTLPDLGGGQQQMDHLLGFAQLQHHQQQQQQAAMAAAVAVTGGLDLSRLLPVSSGYGHDGSLSCPLPPVFASSALGGGSNAAAPSLQGLSAGGRAPSPASHHVSCTLPRIPTAPGSGFGAPTSPLGSDTGRDAPSPVGADGRDTQVPAPGKKGARWSAPVSPSNSSKGGNDLAAAADDLRLSGLSGHNPAARQNSSSDSSESSAAGGGSHTHLHRMASDNLALGLRGAESLSFSAGVGQSARLLGATGTDGSGSSDAGSALLMVGDSPLEAAQVQAALSGELVKQQHQHQQHGSSMGKEKAAQLLAQLPEDAVQKLLALVQQQSAAGGAQ